VKEQERSEGLRKRVELQSLPVMKGLKQLTDEIEVEEGKACAGCSLFWNQEHQKVEWHCG